MPRRKAQGDDQMLDPVITMLPPVRTASKHPRELDPYESPPGAVPVTLHSKPKAVATKADLALRDEARAESRARADRYVRYLEARAKWGADVVAALAEAYRIPREQAEANRIELQHDVRQGLPATSVADIIEANDVGEAAQIAMLARHMYSDVPAASLKAIDMLGERGGKSSDSGTWESYLRMIKARGKSA